MMAVDAHLIVVGKLRESAKYRNVCFDTLYRVAGWSLERHENPKQAIKAAKRKLHQVYGAYLDQMNMATLASLVGDLPPASEDELLRDTCRRLLRCHSSTRERLAVTGKVYGDLWEATGRPRTILDLACGVNPFAWPWMNLEPSTRYCAIDMDHRLISHINTFFSHLGMAEDAACQDILTSTPRLKADAVLLFKALPVLEQQEKGSSIKLLEALRARYAVVSFPSKSLGNREKGMRQAYDSFMGQLLNRLGVTAKTLNYTNETFYVVDMGG